MVRLEPLLFVVAGLLAACQPDFTEASRMLAGPEVREPVRDRRHTYYLNDPSRPRMESEVLVFYDGTSQKHGREREWSETGTLTADREFSRGEPVGVWRTWYSSGKPRSETAFATAAVNWSWWYESGQLSSQGPAVNGVRQGRWTAWHGNGNKSWEGDYSSGKRNGPWSFWSEDGSLLESGEFRAGLRVGTWRYGP